MLQESGHLNPTFALARQLQTRGWDVRYLAAPDLAASIETQGFATLPLFPALFPLGSHGAAPQGNVLQRRRAITERYRQQLSQLADNHEGALVLSQARADLMLIDVTQTHFALWARRAGIPFVYLNTSLPQTEEPGLPPLRSARLTLRTA